MEELVCFPATCFFEKFELLTLKIQLNVLFTNILCNWSNSYASLECFSKN